MKALAFVLVCSLSAASQSHEQTSDLQRQLHRIADGENQGFNSLKNLATLLSTCNSAAAFNLGKSGLCSSVLRVPEAGPRIAAVTMEEVPSYLQLFRQNLDDGVSVWEAQNWPTRDRQRKTFGVLLDEIDFSNQRVLDVGCGQGDFAKYLESRGVAPALYHGVDGVPEFIAEAKRTAPSWAEYEVGDPLADPNVLGSSWDWVVLSGVVATMTSEQADRLLRGCWKVARPRQGMAFNFLSRRAGLFASSKPWNAKGGFSLWNPTDLEVHRFWPKEIVEMVSGFGAKRIQLRHDYMGDFEGTIFLRNDFVVDVEKNAMMLRKVEIDDQAASSLPSTGALVLSLVALSFGAIVQRRDAAFNSELGGEYSEIARILNSAPAATVTSPAPSVLDETEDGTSQPSSK